MDLLDELISLGIEVTVEDSKIKLIYNNEIDLSENYLQKIRESKELILAQYKLKKSNESTLFPTTPTQRSMYSYLKQNPNSTSYNMTNLVETDEDVNIEKLKYSIRMVIDRHESLRANFIEQDNQLLQKIHPYNDNLLNFSCYLLDNYHELEIENLLKKESNIAFNLSDGSLFRTTVIITPKKSIILFCLHHIIGDLASLKILYDEIYTIYSDQESNLPIINQQFKDYCIWLNNILDTTEIDERIINEYIDFQEPTIVPYNLDTKEDDKYRSCRKIFTFEKKLISEFVKYCKKQEISVYVGICSVISILINKITNKHKICFGSPITTRPILDHNSQIGYYVNTVPILLSIDDDIFFSEQLKRNRNRIINLLNLSFYPLSGYIKKIQEVNPNIKELFKILVVYQNQFPQHKKSDSERFYNKMELNSKYDIIFEFFDDDDDILLLRLEYNKSLYDEKYILNLCKIISNIIFNIVKNLDFRIKDLEIITCDDIEILIKEINDSHKEFPTEVTILSLFENNVLNYPHRTVLIHKDIGYTYLELNELANKYANYLYSMGCTSKQLIPIVCDKSIETIIGIISILKLGCAYVPIDSTYPKERQDMIISLLYNDIVLDHELWIKFEQQIDKYSNSINFDFSITSSDLLYVIFTSGSTGIPKGCKLDNKGIVNRLNWMWNHYNFSIEDIFIQKTSFSFDVSVWELFLPLCWGGRLILSEKGDEQSPHKLIELISKFSITYIHFVPSMFDIFIDYIDITNVNKILTLKNVFCSGEVLERKTVQKWYNICCVPISNLYGPTEASIDVTYYDIDKHEYDKIYIGKPIDNINIFILNKTDNIMPVGITGEICISGI